MRHCGNGIGSDGDVLLSLREPVCKGNFKLWKPHLTFILNEGYLGEMKGFANQKPASRFHPHIEELLGHDMVKGIRGGGFLPISNFSFMDFETSAQTRILEKRPDFEFDMIPSEGDSFLTFSRRCRMAKVEHHLMPDQAIRSVAGWYEDIPQWYVLRKYLEVGETRKHLSLGWCFIEKGKNEYDPFTGEPGYCQGIWGFVENPRGKNYLRRHSFRTFDLGKAIEYGSTRGIDRG